MKFTYNDPLYAIPYPFLDDPATVPKYITPERTYLPDQVLAALEETARPQIKPFWDKYRRDVSSGDIPELLQDIKGKPDRIIIPGPPMSWEETFALTRGAIQKIDSDMGARFDRALEKGWIATGPADGPGLSSGECDPEKTEYPKPDGCPAILYLWQDDTINDPVYLAHEAGHYTAYDRGYGPLPTDILSQTQRMTGEVQAYFFQHAFYDSAIHPERPPELGHAIDLQKRANTLKLMNWLQGEFAGMDASRLVRGQDRFSEAGYAELEKGYLLHANLYSSSYFIAAGLWERYKGMTGEEKKQFLSMLYPTTAHNPQMNGIPPLEGILAAAGIHTEEDFKVFMKEAVNTTLNDSISRTPRVPEKKRHRTGSRPAKNL